MGGNDRRVAGEFYALRVNKGHCMRSSSRCLGPNHVPSRHTLRARRAAEAWEDKKAGQKERAALSAVATQVAALVTAHDAVLGDEGALAGAKRSLGDLLSSSSIEEADAKIDAMAAEGRLSPATVLALARAYNGVNESAYTKEEVKDVMAHLYFKARETYFRQAPPEIRILKYLLTIPSDRDRELLLDAAFQPGNVRVCGVDTR